MLKEIADSPSLSEIEGFHGHLCPGLVLGYRVARVALGELGCRRAGDEELVAVVENDSCAVDAIQVIAGCTFGKGNLIYHPYGKHVYTFYRRETGEGVRISEDYLGFEEDDDFGDLRSLVMSGDASPDQEAAFRKKMREKSEQILNAPADEFLKVSPAVHPMPEKAKIEPSERCARCDEVTMSTKLIESSGQLLCKECFDQPVERQ